MCNVDEDGEKAPIPRTKSLKSAVGRKCVKCDQPGVLITRIHDSFCRDCFIVYVVHKFRSAIGKSKLIRDGENVLVAFSGGTNSSALLNLIIDGLSERAHKKLRFRPKLLYVDECTCLDTTDEERQTIQSEVIEIMSASGFPAFTTSLEQGLDKPLSSIKDGTDFFWESSRDSKESRLPLPEDQQRLKALVSSLASTTSKEDFLRNLRRQLIVAVARSLGLKKVLMGDCSTRLSVQILTDISQGRGSQVALDTAFSDARYDDVMIVRPVRDLNAKELALYNHLCGVRTVTIPALTTKAHVGASLERLTESFVTGLQTDYPSTVSNIVRTSEKLLQPDSDGKIKCSFCQSPLDTDVGMSSALNAIRFSKKLSKLSHHNVQLSAHPDGHHRTGSDQQVGTSPVCAAVNHVSSCSDDSSLQAEADLLSSMCFGCQLSLRDFRDDLDTLPRLITSRVPVNRQVIAHSLLTIIQTWSLFLSYPFYNDGSDGQGEGKGYIYFDRPD